MICPKCGNDTWDNRPRKAAGTIKSNAPDFKCKDTTCGWIQWPDKQAGDTTAAPTQRENYPKRGLGSDTAAPADDCLQLYRRWRWSIENVRKAYSVEEFEILRTSYFTL